MELSLTILINITSFYMLLKLINEVVRLYLYISNHFKMEKAVKDLNDILGGSIVIDKKAN